jgi:hypothetical protein
MVIATPVYGIVRTDFDQAESRLSQQGVAQASNRDCFPLIFLAERRGLGIGWY